MPGNFNFSYGALSAIIFPEWIVRQQPSSMTYVNSHTPRYALFNIYEPFHMYIYCDCLIIGMPTNLLVFRENGYQSPGDYTYSGTYFKVQILYIDLFI